ncbi:MAG TPA: HDOD domain-containing protein [Desulfuromonadales bacterium]|nr:HDOD domain-containing protein [Desulfuromonadales bacterium]
MPGRLNKIIGWFMRSLEIEMPPASVSEHSEVSRQRPDRPSNAENSGPAAPEQVPASTNLLPAEARAFLLALLDEQHSCDLQALSIYDREFIASLLNKLSTDDFEIPLLPEGATRIQKIINDPMSRAADYADIIKSDPALSTALIKMVNSPFYVAITPIKDLQLAVARVGLQQIQGLVVLTSLKSRILNARGLRREVEWLTELSLHMALVCQQLAPELSMSPSEAFTCGFMRNVEYFAILSVTAQHISAHQGAAVSTEALIEVLRRLGPSVHDLIIRSWGQDITELQIFMPPDELGNGVESHDRKEIQKRLDALQRIVIEAWSGTNPELVVEGLRSDSLKRAIESLLKSTEKS